MLNYRTAFFSFMICIFATQFFSAQETSKIEVSWEDKLFAKTVNYENFACQDDDKNIVAEFFKNHPLIRIINICHNNCAVLESFSNRQLIPFPKPIIGEGFIAIHVLAEESGRPIYARAVNGNPLIQKLVEKRACESKFKKNTEKRQRVIYYCPIDKCTQPQPVQN